MTAAKYNAFRQAILNHCLGVTPYTAPSTVKVRLFTVAPTAAGGGTAVSGGGYADVTIAWDGTVTGTADVSGIATQLLKVDFGFATGADWGTIVALDIRRGDNNALMYWATLTSAVAVLDGQGFAFKATDLQFIET